MKKVLIYMMLAVTTLTVQSCLHDNEDTFERSAAERIDDAVANTKNVLQSAENGWKFEYYLGSDYSHGGYNYLVKFGSDGKAHVSSEIAPSDMVTSSSWDIIKDQGPVLTFNTYNVIMHEHSQPMQNPVDGLEGDYEFVVMKVTNDSIYLKGKKWGNQMLLTRLSNDVVWQDYISQIQQVPESMVSYLFDANIGGQDIVAELDQNNNSLIVTAGDAEEAYPYVYATNGIKLREPLTINGVSVQNLTFSEENQTFTGENGIILKGRELPKMSYDEIPGTYLFTSYSNRKITIVANGDGETFTINNFTAYGSITATYNKKFGSLDIAPQYAGSYFGVYTLWLCPCDGSSFSWDASEVFTGVNSVDSDGVWTMTFKNSNYPTFWLMAFSSSDVSGDTYAGYLAQFDEPFEFVKLND